MMVFKSDQSKRVFVLGGGGSRGALQVGALRALIEADLYPDLMVGTSIGAVNALFLSMHGLSLESIDALTESWHAAASADLLPANTAWLTMRIFFNRIQTRPYLGVRNFFISQGVTPEMQFADLPGPPVIMVSADLNSGQPVYHGSNPKDNVLEGLQATTALPPWISPIEIGEHFLIDGGAVSNLPIETAVVHGAAKVLALSLTNMDEVETHAHGFGPYWTKYLYAIEARQVALELQVAQANGVPVQVITLKSEKPVSPWDFSHTQKLIDAGYQQVKAALESGEVHFSPPKEGWLDSLKAFFSR